MVRLNAGFFTDALQGKTSRNVFALPLDAELLDLKFDLFSREITAIVRSDSFEDVPDGCPIPELGAAGDVKSATLPQGPARAVAEPKPAPAVRSESRLPGEVSVHYGQQVGAIRNEFSPEQQKVLGFKVEGERIVVKPTQFLKSEWEDINETVKSLGGRWVKGDIISYWEIPVEQKKEK